MDYVDAAGHVAAPVQHRVRGFADVSAKTVFASLLALIVLTAVPYGTVEPWWKAFFICAIMTLSLLSVVEGTLSGSWHIGGREQLIPLVVACVFAFLQTVPFGARAIPSITHASWNAVSADPYGTRFFVLQLLALTLAAALLFRYASTERRLRIVINVIIAVAVVSAIFGMMRQTTQHSAGFIFLPLIKPGQGYGQFVNQNHFAFLMEMGFGLTLGMILGGGVRRERALICFAALLPIWTALVLSNSRGGLLAMLVQIIAAVLVFPVVVPVEPNSAGLKVLQVVRLWPVRVLLLVLLLLGVVGGTLWIGGDRLASRFEPGHRERDPSAVSRKEIWQATWDMWKAHPIAGVGMGGYWVAIPGYHNASGTLVPQEAHNDYLELLASGGIVGAAIGIWFGAVLFKRVRTTLRSPGRFRRAASFGAVLGIVGVGVHSLFDFGLHMIVNALIFMTLIVIATTVLNDESKAMS
ncbi:MAG: O-antigen ligase family protein [Pyrinomonadaceae bacterium]|nr:O-antigen ligase family protein [Pyrinomonadaceae bacterium]